MLWPSISAPVANDDAAAGLTCELHTPLLDENHAHVKASSIAWSNDSTNASSLSPCHYPLIHYDTPAVSPDERQYPNAKMRLEMEQLRPPMASPINRLQSSLFWYKRLEQWTENKSNLDIGLAVKIAMSISGWYISSIILTLFNKMIWTEIPTARQNTASLIAIQSLVMSAVIATSLMMGKIKLSFLTFKNVCFAFFPMAALASMDIAFTNSAYSYVSVSVVVVIKSSLPCLTYLCGTCAGIYDFNWSKVAVLLWIAATVSFTVKEMKIDGGYTGVLLAILAVLTSALRWTLTHIFVKRCDGLSERYNVVPETLEPLQLIAVQQPLILISLLPVVLWHDNAWHKLFPFIFDNSRSPVVAGANIVRRLTEIHPSSPGYSLGGPVNLSIYGLVSSLLAFAVVASEVYIIKFTDSTTFTVGGIGKEVLVLLFSCLVFGDTLSLSTQVAILATLAGIGMYAVLARRERVQRLNKDSTHSESLHVKLESASSPIWVFKNEEHTDGRVL